VGILLTQKSPWLFLVENFFRNFPLFDDFTNDDLYHFFKKLEVISIQTGDILLEQGSIGKNLFFLEKGILEIYITGLNQAYVHVVDNRTPPSIIGEMEFFDNKPIIGTVKAKTDCKLYVISYDDFGGVLNDHPSMNQKLVTIILSKWRNIEDGIHQVITAMLKSNDYLSQFAATISHDLKAPLQAIMGFTQLLHSSSDHQDSMTTDNYINRIHTNIQLMSNLIEGILKYSIAIKNPKNEFGLIDTKEILKEVIQVLNPSSDIKIQISQTLPKIHANRIQMIQVFQNLLDNAIKYLDKPEKIIKIDCKSIGSFWEFSITDNGVGIKKDDYTRILKIFQKVEENTHLGGTGIGLAIVERIVILHGGKLWLESEFGKGTTFFFTISKLMIKYMISST
jgi:signal transduction histidine kinase